MAAGKILHLALTEDRNMTVSAGRCKRVRFRKSECRACADVCPEAVVSLDPGPRIGTGCSDCGLCRTACPTDAFRDERNTDGRMLAQARSLLAKNPPTGEKKRLSIRCRQADGESGRSLVVSCLGNITENVLLGVAISGFDEVGLTKGICAECRLKQGEALFAHAETKARGLLEAMGFRQFCLNVEERGCRNGKEEVLTRREIFSAFSREAKDRAASFLYRREKAIREKIREGLGEVYNPEIGDSRSPRREFLRALITPEGGVRPIDVQDRTALSWTKMAVDATRCLACGTCHMLCPTGAIVRTTEDAVRHLYFSGSSCTNCFLCREACPARAIDFRKPLVLADLLNGETHVVAEVMLASCRSCGEEIPRGKGEMCPTCRRRWPEPVQAEPTRNDPGDGETVESWSDGLE